MVILGQYSKNSIIGRVEYTTIPYRVKAAVYRLAVWLSAIGGPYV
jgi:hypothetical protein